MAKRYAPCVRKYAKSSRFNANTLQKVYNRGIGAYKTNPRSVRSRYTGRKNVPASQRYSAPAWACARVKSFVGGSRRHDLDLRKRR